MESLAAATRNSSAPGNRCLLLQCVCILTLLGSPSVAQDAGDVQENRSSVVRSAVETDGALVDAMAEQIQRLNAASFRVRQAAISRLELNPLQTLHAIETQMPLADPNVAGQLVNLLSGLATHSSIQVSTRARSVLQDMSRQPTYAGLLATNTLSVIADVQERQAIKKLKLEGARIDDRSVILHNMAVPRTLMRVLELNDGFHRSDDCLQRITALNSIDTLILDSIVVDVALAEAVSQMKNLRNVKMREVSIDADALAEFRRVSKLEYFEVSYTRIDDSFVPVLASLPISIHVRLYGTEITKAASDRLAQQLDSVEVYLGKGGFLGVGTQGGNVVSRVLPFSAADLAGIRLQDKLTHLDGEPIEDFDELRRVLGKYRAGEKLTVRLERMVNSETVTLDVEVKLGMEQRDR
ncbi:MAG: PDZ domain-containing protein [Aureliella sp.]